MAKLNAQGLKAIEDANDRGLSFHVFVAGNYHSSWRSLALAGAVAGKEISGAVYNDFAKKVN